VTSGTCRPGDGSVAPDGQEYTGGTPAPASATYETVNLFGRRTGHCIVARQGEILPALPRGFAWVAPRPQTAPGEAPRRGDRGG